nr:MAG TPA: hypothetical protein [Caudoviricetes sp.]
MRSYGRSPYGSGYPLESPRYYTPHLLASARFLTHEGIRNPTGARS